MLYGRSVRALQLRSPAPVASSPLRFVELPDPAPAPDELVLAVVVCAVCRTDLQLAEGDIDPRRLPIVPGHQAVGRVEKVGAEVVGWELGERAGVAWLASTCGACRFCTTGRENLCPNARFTGWDLDGGFATRIAVRADFALRLPEGFSDLAAAPLLCGGVIGYRSLRSQASGRAAVWACSGSVLPLSSRSRSPAIGIARSTSGRDRRAISGGRSTLVRPVWPAMTRSPHRSTRR
jgi:propanol-preferring alcohol dehydrogenase